MAKLLNKILKTKPQEEKPRAAKKQPVPPQTLEPFYDELELLFGASPEECKTARNTLLKKYHPDKNAKNSAFATRKTIKIKEAYDAILGWWKDQDPPPAAS
ncbi:MAG: DnaJ domain-containing protein [Treponema sp.]|nr:DnaJ domain-containing protein [Treponema sp.]